MKCYFVINIFAMYLGRREYYDEKSAHLATAKHCAQTN